MDFHETIVSRHSTRCFTNQQIKIQDIYDVVNEARRAPSWVNAQEVQVHIATGETAKKIRKDYEERSKTGVIGVSDFSVVHRTEWSKAAQLNMTEMTKSIEQFLGENMGQLIQAQDTLFNAPTLIFLVIPKNASKWAILDLGAFEQSILLSATSRGIDSIVAYAIVKYPDIIRKYMNISDNDDIAIGIGLGYADEDSILNKYRSKRASLNGILNIKQ